MSLLNFNAVKLSHNAQFERGPASWEKPNLYSLTPAFKGLISTWVELQNEVSTGSRVNRHYALNLMLAEGSEAFHNRITALTAAKAARDEAASLTTSIPA